MAAIGAASALLLGPTKVGQQGGHPLTSAAGNPTSCLIPAIPSSIRGFPTRASERPFDDFGAATTAYHTVQTG
jgi:hypothetical protein